MASISIPTEYNKKSVLAVQKEAAEDLVLAILSDADFRKNFLENPEKALRETGVLDTLAQLNAIFQKVNVPEEEMLDAESGCSAPSSCCCVTGIY